MSRTDLRFDQLPRLGPDPVADVVDQVREIHGQHVERDLRRAMTACRDSLRRAPAYGGYWSVAAIREERKDEQITRTGHWTQLYECYPARVRPVLRWSWLRRGGELHPASPTRRLEL